MSGSTRRSPGEQPGSDLASDASSSGAAPLRGSGPDPAREPAPAQDPLDRLVAALCGDLLLQHASGQRVLDLGYGCPEVTSWVRRRSGRHLSIVERELLDGDPQGLKLDEYADASFDLVYCLSVFPHLGENEQVAQELARTLLAEATRVLEPGGILALELANPRSLHGLREGIRQPITVVSSRALVSSDRGGIVTRWETPSRLRELAPESLRLQSVHGLGVFIPNRALLSIPGLATVLRKVEWWARDRPVLQHFGRRLLVLLRKQVQPERTLAPNSTQS